MESPVPSDSGNAAPTTPKPADGEMTPEMAQLDIGSEPKAAFDPKILPTQNDTPISNGKGKEE